MLFSKPIAFAEALKSSKLKKLLPTAASSADLAKLEPQIRERARFMARVNHVGTLARLDAGINAALGDGEYMDPAQIRLSIKQQLVSIGYDPENPPKGFEPAKPGSLRDISSDGRLNLAIDTNLKMAYGFGQWQKANDPDILDAFPCRELLREEERKEKRNWLTRWVQAGGRLYGPNQRMIARKDDPIWVSISTFGNPYPPFDYNSGMGVEEVDRAEAEALGVIKPSTIVQRDERSFNEDVTAAMPTDVSDGLAAALKKAFKVVAGRIVLEVA